MKRKRRKGQGEGAEDRCGRGWGVCLKWSNILLVVARSPRRNSCYPFYVFIFDILILHFFFVRFPSIPWIRSEGVFRFRSSRSGITYMLLIWFCCFSFIVNVFVYWRNYFLNEKQFILMLVLFFSMFLFNQINEQKIFNILLDIFQK